MRLIKLIKSREVSIVLLIVLTTVITVLSSSKSSSGQSHSISTLNREYTTVKGEVIDADSRKPLHAATISIAGSNIGTSTNIDGLFSINIPNSNQESVITISYMGYKTALYKTVTDSKKPILFKLEREVTELNEVLIFKGEAEKILHHVKINLTNNYPTEDRVLRAFFRESIAKGKRYTALSEAVIDIDKASYSSNSRDKMWLYRGRKRISQGKRDTLLFKLQGGPGNAIYLDHAKYTYHLLDSDVLSQYSIEYIGTTKIDSRSNYIIKFQQLPSIDRAMSYGNIYVDSESYAISKIEFDINLKYRDSATALFIKKKPNGAKVYPVKAHYIINYKKSEDRWIYSYGRAEVSFKVEWKRRLFNSYYHGVVELAVTDSDHKLPKEYLKSDRLRENIIISDKIEPFLDSNFWGDENTIEPDKSIENAIKKIVRKEKR